MAMSPQEQLLINGYVNFEQLLATDYIDDLRLKAEAVLHRTSQQHRDRFKSNGSLCNLAELPEFANLISSEDILSALEATGGDDIRWTSGYLISKPPGGAPLFWHQDWWGWDSPMSYQLQPMQLFVMIYLTDTRIENGCLRVIPGSHRTDHRLHSLPAAHTKDIATKVDEESDIYASHPDEVAIQVKRGDVLVGDSRLLHSAYANKSSEERPLMTLWYIPNWSSLPEDVQSGLQAIYDRKVVDIDAADENLPTCNDWPDYAFQKVARLLPDYQGGVAPLGWNRIPDRQLLNKGA